MTSHPEIGIIGPEGHILPMAMYYSNNADKVRLLCERMALDVHMITKLYFVAGTMFYARLDALQPLMALGLAASDFEEEEGQVDGTLAHAIERALGASCLRAGLLLIDTKSTVEKLHAKAVLHYTFSI
jgi:lipopolysaccharide biosynthesis protein